MAKTQIKDYVFKPGMSATGYVYPNAYALLYGNKYYIQKEATAWIAAQVAANATGFAGYTYDVATWETEISNVIDAWLWDTRYGGNEETRKTASEFWEGTVSQFDGDRQAEIKTYEKIRDIIRDFIYTNSLYSGNQTDVIQATDTSGDNAESGAINKINELSAIVINVITLGLDQLPALVENGVGNIKVQGRWGLDELLLITNTTNNEIIYNFSQSTNGGTAKLITKGHDPDFGTFLQTTDAITQIWFNYDTSSHKSTDSLQVFVEKVENGKSVVQVRPYDFGTDAIERMRIANPLSMLDADFEYGLQPTKWSAIGTLRGYPSVYEIPATNTAVENITTDASAGTSGVGASLITVTTVVAHGFNPGDPITIKALENSVQGVARAEGSFVINSVPSSTTFTYFAKSKVGTSNGEVLVTTYCQLRKAAFYTGASIGQPEFAVSSNGSSGALTSQLAIASGSTIIPFDGSAPEIGSPLTHANIPTGSQVTQILDTSAGGGTYLTGTITDDVAIGANRVYLESVAGVNPNLAADRGDGTAIYVQSVGANYLDFTDTFTSALVPNKKTYTGVTGNVQNPVGSSATFNVTLNQDGPRSYGIVLNAAGSGYVVSDRIIINGVLVGGLSGTNDVTISVTGVNGSGGITTFTHSGAHWDGTATYTGQSAVLQGNAGTGAIFDLNFNAGAYTSAVPATGNIDYVSPAYTTDTVGGSNAAFTVNRTGATYSVTVDTVGSGYLANETFSIPGTQLGGANPANNATITINTVNGSGGITGASITGTANNTTDASSGYTVNDVIKILGTDLGGSSPVHDLYVTVSSVSGGAITGTTTSGTPPPFVKTYAGINTYTYSGAAGSGALFDVQNAAGTYSVNVTQAGVDYLQNETFTIAGTLLGGSSPTNDATITVQSVGASGGITSATITGTGSTNGNTRDVSQGTNQVGTGATFDIAVAAGVYSVSINNAGSLYGPGQTLKILGTALAGSTPANDLTITVQTVDADSSANFLLNTMTFSGNAATIGGPFNSIGGNNDPTNGVNATFTVAKNFASYDTVTPAAGGSGYKIGDRFVIPGTSLSGASPANDITVTVSQVGGTGAIEVVTNSYSIAEYGTNFDLISTVTISEATTGAIAINQNITYSALATLQVTWPAAHGLVPGDTFIVSISSDDAGSNNHALAGGSFFVTEVPSITTIRYQARTTGAIDTSGTPIAGIVYPRPDSFFVHRPYDGGVQLGTGGPQHGAQAIRQSKKYIRYQSGKGIMYTTGALFAPSYDLQSVTADGVEVNSLITITTDDNDHGVQVGGVIRLLGIETEGYNSGPSTAVGAEFDYIVTQVVDERTFKVRSKRRLGNTTAVLGFSAQMSVVSWHGATVRSGIFDDQNGIFWEFDGTQISAVQRTGTKQIAGTIALNIDSNAITGTNTRFRDQLKAGDRVIIKGMTHVVTHISSDTAMTITPDWRGVVNITGAKVALVSDKKAKQSEFNLDRLDGTGPSGYNMDVAKMQMIGIQYTWYGAGFIDWMARGADGNFVFAHRMRNSNVNTEAFMRSGNLPVRYEVTNEGPPGKLKTAMTNSQTTIVLEDSSFFPVYGTVYIDNEVMTFTGNNKATNTLTGVGRAGNLLTFQAGAERSYSAGSAATHDARTGVILLSQTITPLISHWGSAFLTDGGFDEDRGYIFSYSETGIAVSTTKQTAFMMRLAPSVSNAITGDLGERELLNRAQLLLMGLEVTSESGSGGIVIEGVLNPQNYPLNPADVGWSGLSGVAQGGQPSFAQIASGGGVTWTDGTSATTANMTSVGSITGVLDSGNYSSYNGSSYVFVSAADYRTTFGSSDSSFVEGKFITGSGIPSNTRIDYAFISDPGDWSGGTYGYFRLSRNTNSSIGANASNHFTVVFNSALTNKNFAYLTTASVNSAGTIVGTAVTGGNNGLTFPANTYVSNIYTVSWGGNTFYEVQFNNSFTGTLALGSGTIEATFEQPPHAQPGETVFSFIAVPGERSTLDLKDLKELTNTPLGGRGTFPNGPDVLAINVYKVTGSDINSNIIIKWGEAQA